MLLSDLSVMFTTCTLGSLICDHSLSKRQSDSFLCVAFHKSLDCHISIILGLYWALMQKKKSGFFCMFVLTFPIFFLSFCVVARKKCFHRSIFLYPLRIHRSSNIFIINSNIFLPSPLGLGWYTSWCILGPFCITYGLLHLLATSNH